MIPKRLLAIAEFITLEDVVADVGSDHGLLPLLLVTAGHPYVYASENKMGPYLRLREETKEHAAAIEVALSDGVANLPNKVTTLVIAGMGGSLIRRILLANPGNLVNLKKIILAPQGNEAEVRRTLNSLNFVILEEKVIKEGAHYYEIMVAVPGEGLLTEVEETFGPINLMKKSLEFRAKWEEISARNNKLLMNPDIDDSTLRSLMETEAIIRRVLKE